jgi:hypothetical protein
VCKKYLSRLKKLDIPLPRRLSRIGVFLDASDACFSRVSLKGSPMKLDAVHPFTPTTTPIPQIRMTKGYLMNSLVEKVAPSPASQLQRSRLPMDRCSPRTRTFGEHRHGLIKIKVLNGVQVHGAQRSHD